VLKARNYMAERLTPAATAERPAVAAASAGVSNPVSFLVPEVRGGDFGPVRSY
jgi:hypothetical protein